MRRLDTDYPANSNPASPEYLGGSAKNVAIVGDGTGTPVVAALENEFQGVLSAVLNAAGLVPDGQSETALQSQFQQALDLTYASITHRNSHYAGGSDQIIADALRTLHAPSGYTLSGNYSIAGQLEGIDTQLTDLGMGWLLSVFDVGDLTLNSDLTLVGDMYIRDLVISPGVTLFTNGYKIFCRKLSGSGQINNEGQAGGFFPGTGDGAPFGTLGGGLRGVYSGGSAPTPITNYRYPSESGDQGGAAVGGGIGEPIDYASLRAGSDFRRGLGSFFDGYYISLDTTGPAATHSIYGLLGGGGGGASDFGVSGNGGGGGGTILVACMDFEFTGVITSNGGAGSEANPVGPNGNGGSGGGAGCIAIVYRRVFGDIQDDPTNHATIQANGGAGGNGVGSGVTGNTGQNGKIYKFRF